MEIPSSQIEFVFNTLKKLEIKYVRAEGDSKIIKVKNLSDADVIEFLKALGINQEGVKTMANANHQPVQNPIPTPAPVKVQAKVSGAGTGEPDVVFSAPEPKRKPNQYLNQFFEAMQEEQQQLSEQLKKEAAEDRESRAKEAAEAKAEMEREAAEFKRLAQEKLNALDGMITGRLNAQEQKIESLKTGPIADLGKRTTGLEAKFEKAGKVCLGTDVEVKKA